MSDLPRVGTILRLNLPGNVTRRCKIIAYGQNDMMLVDYVDYSLADEWVPVRYLDYR